MTQLHAIYFWMNVYHNRMVNLHKLAGTIPAMMSALERTAVSVTSDGRTERGHVLSSQPWFSPSILQ
jgi:hypothetical protein